ncbi:MAG: xanthine dehydrogenase family protein subunit M [Candidatus Undinarchaeales archaeon]|jgi:carbon-monoxide dehydrogenase medium subunit|nr:xanthine dehydrogenase family protein subunit M [Candidatus Undinarchaeales archaeon]MDP7492564.1 xanthine dehydrogenase family protein subunit M [Candidatus Undinarchaeales archaeon]
MEGITFADCSTINDVLEVLTDKGADARCVAGGTDLYLLMQKGTVTATTLIDLTAVDSLRYVKRDGDVFRIGATARLTDVLNSKELQDHCPILTDIIAEMASPLIRNRGTLAGNIAYATPAADTAPPLMVLEARVKLLSKTGEREMSLDEYFIGNRKTAIRPDELLAEVIVPVPPPGFVQEARKLGRRKALCCSVTSVAAGLAVMDGLVVSARVAMGSVAPTPVRAAATEEALEGADLRACAHDAASAIDLISSAEERIQQDACPICDVRGSDEYRRTMVAALIRDILRKAIAAQGGEV